MDRLSLLFLYMHLKNLIESIYIVYCVVFIKCLFNIDICTFDRPYLCTGIQDFLILTLTNF